MCVGERLSEKKGGASVRRCERVCVCVRRCEKV